MHVTFKLSATGPDAHTVKTFWVHFPHPLKSGARAYYFVAWSFLVTLGLGVKCGIFLLVSGCGLPSEHKTEQNSGSGPIVQTFSGIFIDADSGKPLEGLLVSIVNSTVESTTDAEGFSELPSTQKFSRDVELLVTASWGSTSFRLEGVPEGASLVSYEAAADSEAQIVEVISLTFDGAPPTPSPVGTAVGHDPRPTPRMTATPEGVNPPPTPQRTPIAKPKPTKKPSGGGPLPTNCLDCHGDRGGTRCGDPIWEAIHRAVFKCPAKATIEKGKMFDLMKDLLPQ